VTHAKVPLKLPDGTVIGSAIVHEDGSVEATIPADSVGADLVKHIGANWISDFSIDPGIKPAYGISAMDEDLLTHPIIHHRNQGRRYLID
jgi:hypothetical protein